MGDRAWLTVREAADRARCGTKVIYRAVKEDRLRAATVSGRGRGRGALLFAPEWVDAWIEATALPVVDRRPRRFE